MVYVESQLRPNAGYSILGKTSWYFTVDCKGFDHSVFSPTTSVRSVLEAYGFYKRGVRLKGIRETEYRHVSGKDPE